MNILDAKKICIIGPPRSGKTYIAKIISKTTDIFHFELDNIVYILEDRKFVKNDIKNVNAWLTKIAKAGTWVAEGMYFFPELIAEADIVVYLKVSPVLPLIRQWSRYVYDPLQRRYFTLLNNINLSRIIIRYNNKHTKEIEKLAGQRLLLIQYQYEKKDLVTIFDKYEKNRRLLHGTGYKRV